MSDATSLPLASSDVTGGRRLLRRALAQKSFLLGFGLLVLFVAIALLAPVLAPHDPYLQNLTARNVPPVWYEKGNWLHPLGTDPLGRDYLSRLLYGARISLIIGISVVAIAGLIGTTMGLVAGYFGGRVDMAVTFMVTTRLAMPVILVALAVVAIIGSSLWIVILVLGLLKWDRFAVVMRSATQQVRSLDYITAAQASGASTARIILREVLPNIAPHRGRDAGSGERHPARSRALLPRPRRAAAAAVLGPDGLRGQGLHVLFLLADRFARHGARLADLRDQSRRRRPARRDLARKAQLIL